MNPLTADWTSFFAAEVGAAATLIGLLVVAISINLSRILSIAQLPGRAAEGLILMVGAFVVASIALVPNQPETAFAVEVLAIGLVTVLAPLFIQLRSWSAAEGVSLAMQYERLIAGAATSLPSVIGGALLLSGSGAGLYWIAAGVIVSLAAGVWNAWILLVEILR
jgi:hypothetical protein